MSRITEEHKMLIRMLLLFTLVIICSGQSNLNSDTNGNAISFHGIIPNQTTCSEAYDHFKYVMGLQDVNIKAYEGIEKYKIIGAKILDTDPAMLRFYIAYLNDDGNDNPTVDWLYTITTFASEKLSQKQEPMDVLFFTTVEARIAQYGNPTEAPPKKYFRAWNFSSKLYDSNYYMKIEKSEMGWELIETFTGKYK
jgi:hypothetical protein